MGKIMEAVFCVLYLICTMILGVSILQKSKGRREHLLYGIMSVVLVCGDAFHLVPRILAAVNRAGDYTVSLGIGKLVTSVTMTLFYLIMYFFYEMHYHSKNTALLINLKEKLLLC